MQVIVAYTTTGEPEVVNVQETLRKQRCTRDAGKLSLKTSAARPTEMNAFAEDGRDILIKLKVGC